MQKNKKYNQFLIAGFFTLLTGFAMLSVLLPDKELSKTERRHYAAMPELSFETVADKSFMSDLEMYLLDHFAGREFFRVLKTETETGLLGKTDANQYVRQDGYLYELDLNWKKSNVTRTAKRLAQFAKEQLAGAKVYYAVIPDKSHYLPKDKYTVEEDAWVLTQLKEQLVGAEYIDLYPYLSIEDYYKTDLHWRQEEITDVAQILLETMGTSDIEPDFRKETVLAEFYGGYAGASAYRVKAEPMYAFNSSAIENAIVYDYELQQETGVYAPEKLDGMDPYDYYLGGARALLSIHNPEKENGKKLLLFRDSFGSSLAPLLLEGYEEIMLVDLRYVSMEYFTKLIDVSSYDDVLFLYSQRVLRHSDSFK